MKSVIVSITVILGTVPLLAAHPLLLQYSYPPANGTTQYQHSHNKREADASAQCGFCALHDLYGHYYLDLSACTTSDCQGLANEAQEKTGADSCVESSSFAGCFIKCYYSGKPDQNSIDQLDRTYC
ncbi:uncharacterized protein BKA55DRAFT_744712 [Fusarium redolens]|uniref:Uncharacterized protein n=1 Tax=Fusarium redolens TaxID=48865 RepID=A0A9P9FWD7_FUSRE|nr:uncharacterized protein BKA55DRAFT_744712 [Fusarium redolens]KAH7205152.1 hypothetical protein BKA55DRAFT_744712 [Fusarium redolens]